MKYLSKFLFTLLAITALAGCVGEKGVSANYEVPEESQRNSMYYWKTVFELDSAELSFLQKHSIKRLYLRMFDVATEPDVLNGGVEIVPIATTKFVSSVPDGVEIVPVAYITIDALRAMAGMETKFASLIVERLLAMASYNKCGKINELQLDCDWTSNTKDIYSGLCETVKDSLDSKGIELSITVRLHQMQETPPPADRGVLMLYNTGALKSPNTCNSILHCDDVKPYLEQMKYEIPLDYAYPVFGWGVKFVNNRFSSIVSDGHGELSDNESVRYERAAPDEILEVKDLVEQNFGKPASGNILYHLDDKQLKNYTDDEISQILLY
jgi:hypothetical protein